MKNKTVIGKFWSNNSGSVITTFALSIPVVAIAAGVTVDYSRAYNARSIIQHAADAAVVAGANVGLEDANQAEPITKNMFLANSRGPSGKKVKKLKAKFNRSNNNMILTANVSVPTTITALLGQKTIDLKVRSQAATSKQSQKVEYVLAIDQSSSMRGKLNSNQPSNCLPTISTEQVAIPMLVLFRGRHQ